MSVRTPGYIKLAIEKEGQLPLLTTFDQARPLEEIIREVCENWKLPIPEQYAFQYSDYNYYITEENRVEIKNGAVLKLTLSPAKQAQEIFERLQAANPEEKRNALKILSNISEDATFASEFIRRNGLGILINMVESKPDNSEMLANALVSFQELMEHGEVSWNILTHGFIKNLTVFVNKKNPVDATVLRRCLSILEAVCTNSQPFYPVVEKEVVFENLVQHLQNHNQDIQLCAIALINSLFMRSSNKRHFADRLAKAKVRSLLLNNIIRDSKVITSEMAHQLYVYQSLTFSLLEDRLLTCGKAQNQNLLESLDTLRRVAFDSELVHVGRGRPLSLSGGLSKEFRRLGFMDIDYPVNDFREAPPGLLPLHNMVYFAVKHQDQYVKVVLENLGRGEDYDCPFARASIALTKILSEILEINGEPPSDSGKEYYPIFFTTEFAFEEFYVVCIQLVNKTWKEMRATSGDFNRVMQVVKDQIVRALGGKHLTMENFKANVFSLGFSQILKILQDEIHARNIMELKARPVVELREQVLPELKEIVKQQRLDQLIQGAMFDRAPGKRARDKFWYCRLSPNLKFLHYGDCEEGQTPTLENLPSKLPVAKLKDLLVGKDCPHAREKRVKQAYLSLYFSLIYDRDNEEDGHLNFVATSQSLFAIWRDGLATLLKKEMPSTESHDELETLLNMEMKLRLLDLENISIPESPPLIPPEPPNFDFVYDFS